MAFQSTAYRGRVSSHCGPALTAPIRIESGAWYVESVRLSELLNECAFPPFVPRFMASAASENHNPNMDANEGEGDTFDDIFDSYREKRVAEMKKQYASVLFDLNL